MIARIVAEHRQHFQADLYIDRLVSRQPPTSLDLHTGVLTEEPAAALGMTMSGRLLRYVSHPEGYGSDFPWSRALFRLRYHCRRNHPYHRASDRPYWRGSLCHELVRFTVIREFSVENAAKILRYDNPEPVLRTALEWIEASMDEARRKAERRLQEDAGHGDGAVPEPARPCYHPDCNGQPHYKVMPHPDTESHRLECPRCRKEDAA